MGDLPESYAFSRNEHRIIRVALGSTSLILFSLVFGAACAASYDSLTISLGFGWEIVLVASLALTIGTGIGHVKAVKRTTQWRLLATCWISSTGLGFLLGVMVYTMVSS